MRFRFLSMMMGSITLLPWGCDYTLDFDARLGPGFWSGIVEYNRGGITQLDAVAFDSGVTETPDRP